MGHRRLTRASFRLKAIIVTFPLIHRVDQRRTDLVRIGSEYGGWWVPQDLLNASSRCYTAGVGTDITFDLGLIERFGCSVWAMDPTPQAVEFVKGQDLPASFSLLPIGLYGEDGMQRFYVPRDAGHVSHSLKNLQRTVTYFEAEVVTVGTVMRRLGHNMIDLLKLDIEGAEHETIKAMITSGQRPTVVCVEYDQPEPVKWSVRTTRLLKSAGYCLAKVDGLNLTFVLSVPVEQGAP